MVSSKNIIKKIISILIIIIISMSSTPIYAIENAIANKENEIAVESVNEENTNSGKSANKQNTTNNTTNEEIQTEKQANEIDGENVDKAKSTKQEKTTKEEETNTKKLQTTNTSIEQYEYKNKDTSKIALSKNYIDTPAVFASTPTTTSDNGFNIALRWSGQSGDTYSWHAAKDEDRVIKLTFYYQNKVASKDYKTGDIKVKIPGIGNLNRSSIKIASDIAADKKEVEEKKRDWSYTYDKESDVYTFYNNYDIKEGESFNGSFELLWEFSSRFSVNGYKKALYATLEYDSKSVLSSSINLEFTSEKDEFTIKKSVETLSGADGLSRFIQDGKKVENYAWVKYSLEYKLEEKKSRGLKNYYIKDEFDKDCIVIVNSGTIEEKENKKIYKYEKASTISDKTYIDIIVGYPLDKYTVGGEVSNEAYLCGTYDDEDKETLNKNSTVKTKLKLIQKSEAYFDNYKTIYPDYINREELNKDISFYTDLEATAFSVGDESYNLSIADDLIEVYYDEQYKYLESDEYKFTNIEIPSKSEFTNSNGLEIEDGDYNVKIYAIEAGNSRRDFTETDIVYEGKWTDSYIRKTVNASAIKVEISGLKEGIDSFYIRAEGTINIANYNDENIKYIRNYSFLEAKDSEGKSLINEVEKSKYEELDIEKIYEEDIKTYNKGLLRAYDEIEIRDQINEYKAVSSISKFEIDEDVEYFNTNLQYYADIDNKSKRPIQNIEIYGTVQEDLEQIIDSLQIIYSNLSFQKILSNDVNLQEYLLERATITKIDNEVKVVFDLQDNPIISSNFELGFSIDAKLSYEQYQNINNPIYNIDSYAYINDEYMKPKYTKIHENKTMAHDNASANILQALASHQQMLKSVKTEYTTEFIQKDAVAPLNTDYTYRLKLRNGYNTLVNTEFIDILEHAELTKIEGKEQNKTSDWYGTFKNVDTSFLKERNLQPKVYYATSLEPKDTEWKPMTEGEGSIWTANNPKEVKAVKIEIGAEIIENSIVYADINMQAPNDKDKIDKITYNTFSINCDSRDVYTGATSSYMDNMPSNVTDVRLIEKEYDIIITKKDATTKHALSGVKFEICDEKNKPIRSNLTDTNILGKTIITGLKPGTYILKEVKAPEGYDKLADITLLISDKGNYTLTQNGVQIAEGIATLQNNVPTINLTIENKRSKVKLKVHKIDEYVNATTDKEGNTIKKEIPLQGVKFNLLDDDGNIIQTKTTDSEGNVEFDELDWGKYYTLQEISGPKGYEIISPQTIYLSKTEKELTIKNERKEGTAILVKQDENDYTPVNGAKYGLYAGADIYGKDGNVLYKKDELIRTITTNSEGEAKFTQLVWGKYYIKEIETTYGYEKSEEKHSFEVNKDNVEQEQNITEKEKRRKATLKIVKMDQDSNVLLKGAKFTLYDEMENIIVKKDEKTDEEIEYITNENGELIIEGLEWGTYYLQETVPPSGYELSNEKYKFEVNRETFRNGETIKKIYKSDTEEEVDVIFNKKKLGKVVLTKYACDAEGKESKDTTLSGAIYDLYQSDGTFIKNYEIKNENGKVEISDLEWGGYYLQESKAPEGYSISNKKISFVINSDNVNFTQQLDAYDKQLSAEMTINKTINASSIYNAHGNATFIFKIVGLDEEGNPQVTYYKTITFSQEDINNAKDGKVTKSITISDLQHYKYEITEETNYRYTLSDIIPKTDNATKENSKGIIDLTGKYMKGEITFENKKTSNSLLTDSKIITNATQSSYYIVGIKAEAKQESYDLSDELTKESFKYTLLYSGGQEVNIDSKDLIVKFDGESETYKQSDIGDYIITLHCNYKGKDYDIQVITKWTVPNEYLIYEVIDESNKTIRVTGIKYKLTQVDIPSTYKGYTVKEIGYEWNRVLSNFERVTKVSIAEGIEKIADGVFIGCTNLKSIKLPKTLTSLGNYAFDGCTSLTSIDLSNTQITSIGNSAFSNCTSLTSVGKLPSTLTSIGDSWGSTFNGCTSLKSIDLSNTQITSIGYATFRECTSLASVKLPSTLTSIGDGWDYTFGDCTSLKSIDLSNTQITSLGCSTFSGCTSLASVKLPSTLTSIGDREGWTSTFNRCTSLASIDLSNTQITSIGNGTFYGCTSLASVKLPNALTSIGNSAFAGCMSLDSLDLGSTQITTLENIFTDYMSSSSNYPTSAIKEIILPNMLKEISEYAFYGCTSLTSLDLSNTKITTLENIFGWSAPPIETIDLPNTLTTISSNVFATWQLTKLTKVIFHGTKNEFDRIDIGTGNDILNDPNKVEFTN